MKSNKIKVGIVYPFFAHYRGAIINEFLKSKEYDFYFLGGTSRNKAYSSLKLYDFNHSKRFIQLNNFWLFNHFLFQFGLIRSFKREHFDFVILLGDWKYLSSWFFLFLLKIKKIPVYFWGHGVLSFKKNINNRLKVFFLKLFDGGFLYSHRAVKIMNKMGFKNDLHVVYNSLDLEKSKKIIDKLSRSIQILSDPVPYLIFSGRIVLNRKLEILFDSLLYLRLKGFNINAVIIGDGPSLNYYKEYVDKNSLNDNVVFYGSCYDEEQICKLYLNSIACVFPGPIGLTAIHSLTYGIPVITNDDLDNHKPEVEAILDNFNGFLFENNNYISLAEKIIFVLNKSKFEKDQISMNAKNVVFNKYNPKVQKEIFIKVINNLFRDV